MLLLLVQDDDAQVLAGGEHGGAGAHDHLGVAALDPLPLVVPLTHAQAAVEHRHLLAEPGRQQPQKLGRQRDFRHQQQRGLPPVQAVLDQADVHGGLAGAGDAVQQRHTGIRAVQLAAQTLEGGLLLRAEGQRPGDVGGPDLPAAEHTPLGEGDVAQRLQPPQGGGGSAGVIADILHRAAAHTGQQLQNAALHGGGARTGGGKIQRLLPGDGQGSHLLGLVPDPGAEVLLGGDPFLAQQIFQRGGENLVRGGSRVEGLLLGFSPQGFQQLQNVPGPLLADGGGGPAAVGGEGKGDLGVEPRPCREHGPGGVKIGAEIPLPQKGGQLELAAGEHGRIVQHPCDLLQPRFVSRFHGKDDALAHFVGPAEGQLDPVAGQQLHSLRDAVGIGLVNGKNSRGNSDFPDHKPSESWYQFLYSSLT